MARSGNVDHVEVVHSYEAIAMYVNKIEAWSGAPMAQQARLDMFDGERPCEQRVVVKVNLADRQIIGGAPVCVDQAQFFGRKRSRHGSVSSLQDRKEMLRLRFRVGGTMRGDTETRRGET